VEHDQKERDFIDQEWPKTNKEGGKFHSECYRLTEERKRLTGVIHLLFLLCIFSLENNLEHPGIVF